MWNGFVRKALGFSLSALVLVWGTVPPGVRHAHAGGGAHHRHDHDQMTAHHASHDHESDHASHKHAAEIEPSLVSDYSLHVHGRLLGIDFSVPFPQGPSNDRDGHPSVPQAVVWVINRFSPAAQADFLFERALQAALRAPAADSRVDLEKPLVPPNVVATIPLCDSARLERSGVLLA